MLCVHKHRDTSPFMMMSADAHVMMMMTVIMLSMTPRGLLTFRRRYRQLA